MSIVILLAVSRLTHRSLLPERPYRSNRAEPVSRPITAVPSSRGAYIEADRFSDRKDARHFDPPGSGGASLKLCVRDKNRELTFCRANAKRQPQPNKITTIVKEFAISLRNAELSGANGVDAHSVSGYLGEVA
jgi:hypothetical protein